MEAFDPETLAFYAKEAPDYGASGPGGIGRHLEPFLERLPPGGKVLELGCGSGRDAAQMIAAGSRSNQPTLCLKWQHRPKPVWANRSGSCVSMNWTRLSNMTG